MDVAYKYFFPWSLCLFLLTFSASDPHHHPPKSHHHTRLSRPLYRITGHPSTGICSRIPSGHHYSTSCPHLSCHCNDVHKTQRLCSEWDSLCGRPLNAGWLVWDYGGPTREPWDAPFISERCLIDSHDRWSPLSFWQLKGVRLNGGDCWLTEKTDGRRLRSPCTQKTSQYAC